MCKQNYFERAHHFVVVQNKMSGENKMRIGAKRWAYACKNKPW
jgi:hypothetical protein